MDVPQRNLSLPTLRAIIGFIPFLIPLVPLIWSFATGTPLHGSISEYYYTPTRNLFVGPLFAIGTLMLTYRGHDWRDWLAGSIAGVACFGIAGFPCGPDGVPTDWVGKVHYTSAGVLFVTLAVFCLWLFPMTSGNMTEAKRRRNIVYWACGMVILWSISAIVDSWCPMIWPETTALFAFGISWIVKSERLPILRDAAS